MCHIRTKNRQRIIMPRTTQYGKGRDRPASVNICSERAKCLPPTMTLRPDIDFINFPLGN